MSESLRIPRAGSDRYAPFPLDQGEDRGGARAAQKTGAPPALGRTRFVVWCYAFAKQRLILFLRPLSPVWTVLSAFFLAIGLGLSRFLRAVGTLSAGAFAAAREASVKSGEHLLIGWHRFKITAGRRMCRRITLVCLFTGLGLCLIIGSFYTLGMEVMLGGQSVGFVTSTSQFTNAIEEVSRRASEILNYPYLPNPDVTFNYTVVDRTSVFNQSEVEDQLFSQISDIKKLDLLIVDGAVLSATSDREGLQKILDGLLAVRSLSGKMDSVAFVQDVELSQQWVAASMERPLNEIAAMLTATTQARYDRVGGEEELADVARRNGMNEEALLALNAGPSNLPEPLRLSSRLPAADDLPNRLLVKRAAPFLTVESRAGAQYEEEIPFETIYVDDNSLYKGESKVRVTGEAGVSLVSVDLLYRDGAMLSCEETRRVITEEAVDEVIAVGTKERPKKVSSGSFIRPSRGRVSSRFGYRSISGGSRNHQGIDFAGSTGDPIVAADGGKVTFAGYRGGYGLSVTIQHANGYSTVYGHCSKLLVSTGQAVAKGEKIAKVGNTGQSTGPHLHFEIRINGTAVNPAKYIGLG
ncbi:MAG: peptidoglycan DD-metalloendopeptidase family protein [Oscillospiraceae bacterium]|nr:peptidoglycan DD-metalloendopeptidase family protein [Oscillospiraceae bacterium]